MNEPRERFDTPSGSMDDIDWWASRLVDGEIAFADVPVDLRGPVQQQADVFGIQRRTLMRAGVEHRVDAVLTDRAVTAALQPPAAVVVPIRRRLLPVVAVAAASIAVIAFGATVLQRDVEPDVVAFDAPAAETAVESAAISPEPAGAPEVTDTVAPVEADSSAQSIDSMPATAPSAKAVMPSDVIEIADMIELSEIISGWWTSPPPLLADEPACTDDLGRPAVAVNVLFAGIEAQAYFSPERGVMLLAVADCLKLASIVP